MTKALPVADAILCPKCNSPMQLKTANKGRNAGGQFYGCNQFPSCRGTRPYFKNSPNQINTSATKKNNPAKASDSNLNDQTRDKFLELIKYYKECVQIENLSDVKFYSNKEGKDFIQCPSESEWLSSAKETYKLKSSSIKDFGKESRWNRRPVSHYYAYPIYVHKHTRRDGQPSTSIRPFLTFPVEFVKASDCASITRPTFLKPQINTGVLDARSVGARPEQKRAFMQRVMEGWVDTDEFEKNIKSLIEIMVDELGETNFVADSFQSLKSELVDLDSAESGFYSCGIIFATQGSNYTMGLEEELNEIERKVQNDSPSLPVIKALIDRNQLNESNGDADQLVEITPLNDEQRQAVRSAFKNDLTIVTGPPGTGKSQVVINIIANAVAKGESVLFGSKNHQAVDVVLERIGGLQDQPIVLKFGQNSKERMFAEKLLSAVDRTHNMDAASLKTVKNNYLNELKKISEHEVGAWSSVKKCYDLRNKIDHFDTLLTSIEERLPTELVKITKSTNHDKFKMYSTTSFGNLVTQLRDNKPNSLSVFLNAIGISLNNRVKKSAFTNIKRSSINEHLTQFFVTALSDSKKIPDVASWIIDTFSFIEIWRNITELKTDPLASASEIIGLETKISLLQRNRSAISPKYIDVLMNERLKRLGSASRTDIADYLATVKRIEEDRIGGEVVEELRKQKREMFGAVVKVFPAIAVTNLSVRHAVALVPGIVDVVVIDEASQCDIASALPMLCRGKRAVIIGDEKQLTHVSTISKNDDQQIQAKHNLSAASDQRFLYSAQSLFDLAKSTVGSSGFYISLKDHYRSRAEIVEFSNKVFYGNQLRVWTDYRRLKPIGNIEGVHWHSVEGQVVRPSGGSAYNLAEAEKVVDVLAALTPKIIEKNATVGIVTPFREQENRIRDLVARRLDAGLIDTMDLKIDTAHGYQGDERDLMIFSTVISKGSPESTIGFLSATQNLFNVAITRARSELHVVGDRTACLRSGVEYLEKFAQYISQSNRINLYQMNNKHELFDSPWEEHFFNKLKERGINATPQLSIHQYKLDLALPDYDPPINIEIDGEHYHKNISGERCIDDVKRDMRLSSLGWEIKRFWVYEIKFELNKCLDQVELMIKNRTKKT